MTAPSSRPSLSATPIGAPDASVSFSDMWVMLRESSRSIAICALVGAIALASTALFKARTYTSTATFIPQSHKGVSAVSGIAAQFGVSLPTADATQSPDFYADLATTREILEPVVESRYVLPGGPPKGQDLADIFGIHESNPLLRLDKAVRRLKESMTAGTSLKTGVVDIAVRAERPELAQAIAQRVLDELNQFNLRTRQSQAAGEEAFAARQMDSAAASLATAENRLGEFLQTNRAVSQAPLLVLERDRLERQVSMRQQVYTSLAQAVDQAKIEAVRDNPVITVIQRPNVPALPDSRGVVKRAALGLVAGGLVAFIVAFARRFGARGGSPRPPDPLFS